LADVADLLSVVTEIYCSQINSIYENFSSTFAVAWIVKALGKLDSCRLARPRRTHYGGGLARRKLVRKSLHDWGVRTRWVKKVNILKLNFSLDNVLFGTLVILLN